MAGGQTSAASYQQSTGGVDKPVSWKMGLCLGVAGLCGDLVEMLVRAQVAAVLGVDSSGSLCTITMPGPEHQE